jgi:hypothetical protein
LCARSFLLLDQSVVFVASFEHDVVAQREAIYEHKELQKEVV